MTLSPGLLAGLLASAVPGADLPAVDYLRDVKPILATRCASCHGAVRRKAGLRLDAAPLIRKGGDGGPAVVPGKSEESPLIERVTAANPAERMPPESEGTPLSEREVALLRIWIDQGAKAPEEKVPEPPSRHWAYRPPARPFVPAADAGERNPIDAFLEAGRKGQGLAANPPLGKDLWLRRVTLDLTGLPPSIDEMKAFRGDDAPGAVERVVDRLLASPRYGERWGRHWMDVWRYSDWYGLDKEVRYSHLHIWNWRDWIVASLNADKGYDRMVSEMLAGDELAPTDPDTLRATGYLVRNWNIFNRDNWLDHAVEHTARAFLGATVQCARCHDHKFDPISQVDYYRLRAFFEPYHIRIDRVPGQPDRTKGGLPRAFDDFLDRPTYLFIRGDAARPDTARPLTPATPAALGGPDIKIRPIALPADAYRPDSSDFVVREELEAAVAQAQAEADAKAPTDTEPPPRPVVYHRAKTSYKETPPNTPYPKTSTGRRLALARWIADRKNPLTARVAVNHIWARHFGEPLVASMSDFGLRSERPIQHELLDWLAVELMESGWSMKHLHRLIVTSDAYRMRSDGGPNAQLDPDNRYLWRMNLRRMEAEVVRDSLLFLAGQLDPTMGGPDLPTANADSGRRRSLYYHDSNMDHVPLLDTFDAPNADECYRRAETIAPQQALALTNSGFALARAADIAAAIAVPDDAFPGAAFERILGRLPTEAERAECRRAFDDIRVDCAGGPDARLRAREGLVHVLLNHNDFITIR